MDESLSSAVQPPRRRLACGPLIAILALIVAGVAIYATYELSSLPIRMANAGGDRLESWAGKVRDAFVSVTGMQPRVTINERVVYEQASPVLELAVLTRPAEVERETQSTWMGSTKHLRLRGLYRIKAGYDLRQPVTATVDGGPADAIRVRMPAPKLLSVEMEKLDVLSLENGLWNHVQPGDFEQEVNFLNLEARQKAWNDGVAGEAQKLLTEELQEKLGPARKVEIVTSTPTPRPGKP